jgi:hypothetical protein
VDVSTRRAGPSSTLATAVLVVLAVLAVLAAPAHAGVTRTGTLRSLHEDRPGKAERDFWALDTNPGLVPLVVKGKLPTRLEGLRVRARGTFRRGRLVVRSSALRSLGRQGPPARAAAAGSFPTAVVLIHLTDPSEMQASSPYQPADVRPGIYGDAATRPYSVRQYYLTQTYGKVDVAGARDPAGGDIFGPYSVADKPGAGGGCLFAYWSNDALNMAIDNDGFDVGAYKAIIYVFVSRRCSFAGAGGGGSQVWINGMNAYTVDHELGHTFGNGHASSLRCWNSGATAIYSATCDPPEEYGDPFDPMGGGGSFTNASPGESVPFEMEPWRKIQIGAMPASDGPVANTPGSYRLTPIERSSGVRMLRFPTGRGDDRFFDLSFRQPIGPFDALAADMGGGGRPRALDGVLVTVDKRLNDGSNSWLLDMTPETGAGAIDPFTHLPRSGFEDAPLTAGRTFDDDVTGLSLTVNAVGPEGADVTVAYGRGSLDVATPTPPGQPAATVSNGVVSLSWPASSDAYGVTRYLVSRGGTGLPDAAGLSSTDSPGFGTFSYTVRAADAAGNVSPPSAPLAVIVPGPAPGPAPPPVTPALALSKLAVTKGLAKITFTLNRAARVTFAFARRDPGRRKGKACVAPSKAPKGKRCTRLTAIRKTLVVSGKAGSNAVAFGGKLDKKTRLGAGSYVVTASAKDAGGKLSRPVTGSFTVPKPAKKKKKKKKKP